MKLNIGKILSEQGIPDYTLDGIINQVKTEKEK